MRDVISSYTSGKKKSHRKLMMILAIASIILILLIYIVYRPWISDAYRRDSSSQRFVVTLENTGSVRDSEFLVEINSTAAKECGFLTQTTADPNHVCFKDMTTKSLIAVKCSYVVPGQKVDVFCNLTGGMEIFNVTAKSRYQFLRRNYFCTGNVCREDESIYSGPMPIFFNYLIAYWGDRLLDLTQWVEKAGWVKPGSLLPK
jgi:hypothetical protein